MSMPGAPERVIVNCSPARTGAWLAWPVVEDSKPLREFEVEYVRADLLAEAVGALRDLVRLVESIDYEDDIGDAEAVANARAIIEEER